MRPLPAFDFFSFWPVRRWSRPASLGALLLACVASPVAPRAQIPLIESLFTPDQPGEATTVRGQTYWLNDIALSTPRDYSRLQPGQPLYAFQTRPSNVPLDAIQRIELTRMESRWLGSRPESMEYYSLGSVRRVIPPPPNWTRTCNQIPAWKRAHPAASTDHLPFIAHAVACWAAPGDEPIVEGDAQVYLFRQALDVGPAPRLARAVLHLGSNAQLIEVWLNQSPLHLAGTAGSPLSEYEVTRLIKPGQNILAVKLRERPDRPEPGYGLAYTLELVEPKGRAAAPAIPDGAALITNEAGDRVWGWPMDIQGGEVRLKTVYGAFRQSVQGLDGLLLPLGWREPPRRPGLLSRLLGAHASTGQPKTPPWGLPLSTAPRSLQDRTLLTDDRVTQAKPIYVRDGQLHFEDADGKHFAISVDQVLGIYPPRGLDWNFRRPRQDDAILYAQLTLTNGDRLSGLLREMNGRRVVLESTGGAMLQFQPAWIADMTFPYHAPAVPQPAGAIALAPQAATTELLHKVYLRDANDVQAAAIAIGAPIHNLELATTANPDLWTPQRYPVTVSVDPAGEYLRTLSQDDDGQQALLSYLDRGGVLVVLSRGGALRTAMINGPQGLRRSPDETQTPPLMDRLGLQTVRPGDKPPAGALVIPFDHPPNEMHDFAFQRAGELPQGLMVLPRRVTLDPMMWARFYPMVSTRQAGTIVYDLADETGQSYGPAMMIVPKGLGTIVIIDHLLWKSRIDNRPFSESVLPLVLRWALETAKR